MARDLGDSGLDALDVACDLTLQTGIISAAIVLNEMRRLTEAAQPKTLADTPHRHRHSRWNLWLIAAVTTACGACAMSIDRIAQLKALHLFGMASAWSEWQAEYSIQQKPVMPEVWLDRLIAAEQVGSTGTQLELPTQSRTLSHPSGFDAALNGTKHRCRKPGLSNSPPPVLWIKPTI